jgi:hypothetical protein
MSKPPPVFEHLGPHARHPPVAACCRLTERVWLTYNDLAESNRLRDKHSLEFLILRMLYIAEITSSAIRLNASWGLTHAAMSLLRDRYEQTLRFSWLVRNPDPQAFEKYEYLDGVGSSESGQFPTSRLWAERASFRDFPDGDP